MISISSADAQLHSKRARYHISHNVIDKDNFVNYFATVKLKSRARKLLPPTACWEFSIRPRLINSAFTGARIQRRFTNEVQLSLFCVHSNSLNLNS